MTALQATSLWIAFVIICQSQNNTIDCVANETDCVIQCNDFYDCSAAITIDMEAIDDHNNITDIQIECNGDYSCQSLVFYENELHNNLSTSTTIECNGLRSCFLSEFYLTNNRNVSIYCGQDEESCSNMHLYGCVYQYLCSR